MMRPHDLMAEFVEALRRMTGAEHAAILLHMEPLERQTMMLANCDHGTAAPELADEASAWELVSAHQGHPDGGQSVIAVPSADPESTLLRVAFRRLLTQPMSERRTIDERRREPDVRTAPPRDGAVWIGLRGGDRTTQIVSELKRDPEERRRGEAWLGPLTGVCLRLAWSVYHLSGLMQDPVSRLHGRMELQVFLKRAIAAVRRSEQAIGLMLVNPDDFTMINHRYGRSRGDTAVREVAEKLAACLRSTDGLFHYGGAVFAAVLPATDLDQCRATAEKLRLHLTSERYVDGAVSLTFSIGAAVASPQDLATEGAIERELSRRADAALNGAKLSGGARAVVIGLEDRNDDPVSSPLGGIFAADTEKDYRNMLLLWETVALISTQNAPEAIARAFVDRLAIGFRPERVALVSLSGDEIQTVASNVRDNAAADGRATGRPLELDAPCQKLIIEALETGRAARQGHEDQGRGFCSYAVPLIARKKSLGCIYLDSRGQGLELDSSDVVFLNALAAQLAVAIDRAELAARWIREKDRESRSLREELRGLREALHHTKMVYQSGAMHALMETLRKVAPSDATVLIVGESGTGKEMLAKSVHEMSGRREAPYVVFDCGAVAHSLLEAELFGHTKGAFTGAERASEGRIAQADGGTLFLDEIGELPLEVQAKLLRFVQEKEFTPVGSNRVRRVDVRIVAATNRKLEDEVGAGRFRADLYYRLRVIAVEAIPLRRRPDDILPLARYFLEKFAVQQGVPTHRLSNAAELKLLRYLWPGNVRELQHCVLRAVLTQDAEVLGAEAIELFPESSADSQGEALSSPNRQPTPEVSPAAPAETPSREDDPWRLLQRELEHQVEVAVTKDSRRPAPIGRWLSEDLVLAANDLSNSVVRQAAQLVRVPESTFRRQLDIASSGAVTGTDYRPDSWMAMRPVIRRVIEHSHSAPTPQSNVLERARNTLLACVREKTQSRASAGASLMGVTPPTYKRWVQTREGMS